MKVAIIGTGFVGLTTGCCLSELGHIVTCIDKDNSKIERLQNGDIPFYEPGLEDLLKKNMRANKLFFTKEITESVSNAEIIFIAVGTPMSETGEADLKYVYAAVSEIAPYLKNNAIIVVKSTVPVGTCDEIDSIIRSNRGADFNYSVVSNPEFLREGSSVNDIMNPDRIIIGSKDQHGLNTIKNLYNNFNCPIIETDLKTSEMIKYASNAFLATKISFINALSVLCEKLDADITMVSRGMGLDKRIGPHFLNAGVGYGGSCFPKDVKALIAAARVEGYEFSLLREVEEINTSQRKILVHKILRHLQGKTGSVGILGLAFKPNTDDMREAPSISVIRQLQENGIQIKAYDPIVMEAAYEYVSDITLYDDVYKAIKDVDAIVLMTEWPQFLELDWGRIAELVNKKVVIDARNVLNPMVLKSSGFVYEGIGRS
ncbi:UDP-glucose/GDP-mannose dehydrogenase family protein [Paenibacillus sp. 32352]|uniref:UDP-glucose dehydrogenase family protein n=1 Tax=Paenibacillus sp. 32352 TaxID=1969111 RepID=UPI0009AC9C9F|nr:UDP-glucose/GDP-mannose dehydrogenase family protein [Paenibacillus sp. 32352]